MKELSYVMVKPDYANNQQVINMVKSKITEAGFEIVLEGFIQYTAEYSKQHYAEHINKDWYPNLEKYITSDKAYGMVVSGENCVETIHADNFMGKTKNPEIGTIRHTGFKMMGYLKRDLSINGTQNVAHSSDSVEAANKEILIFKQLLNN